ncbi:MAG: type IV pilus secretin PilQ [Vibrionaceae bacterium]
MKKTPQKNFSRVINSRLKGSLSLCWLSLTLAFALAPAHAAPQVQPTPPLAREEIVSMNFQDIPIRSVLQIIAEHQGLNLVVSDSVRGNITMQFKQVPWLQMLNTILQVKGLGKTMSDNILLVAPIAELEEQSRIALTRQQQLQALEPLISRVFKINYANAESLKAMLSGGVQDAGSSGISLLSNRGSIAVDQRTNSLIVKETGQNMRSIAKLVKDLDVPVSQVEIETRIVTIDDGVLEEIGVRWGISKTARNYGVGGSIEHNNPSLGGSDEDSGDKISNMLNLNLGANNPKAGSIAFQVGSIGRNFLLDLELSALQAESKAEIISSPRLVTTNKRAAYIEQGTELPYLESSSSGAASVAFKKAVLSLGVTPQITNDKKLILDLDVTQDKPADVVQSGTGEAVAINTQRISTQVLVNNGETIVLGGIYQHEMITAVDKVPVLGDLPQIGRLFRRNYETVTKRELLIFVTPRIVTKSQME